MTKFCRCVCTDFCRPLVHHFFACACERLSCCPLCPCLVAVCAFVVCVLPFVLSSLFFLSCMRLCPVLLRAFVWWYVCVFFVVPVSVLLFLLLHIVFVLPFYSYYASASRALDSQYDAFVIHTINIRSKQVELIERARCIRG